MLLYSLSRTPHLVGCMQDGEEAPPKPTNDDVSVECFPEWTAHVRSYDGFPSPDR